VATAVAREPKNLPCFNNCGCDAEGNLPPGSTWEIPGVVVLARCPRRCITARSHLMLQLHRHYLNGVLPVSGGLLDQPHAYYLAMTTIDEWMNRG
jgi:hypothetical protein